MENWNTEEEKLLSPEKDTVIEAFGSRDSSDFNTFEGACLLKTKSDKFKKHWAILMGNEIYCYRN